MSRVLRFRKSDIEWDFLICVQALPFPSYVTWIYIAYPVPLSQMIFFLAIKGIERKRKRQFGKLLLKSGSGMSLKGPCVKAWSQAFTIRSWRNL